MAKKADLAKWETLVSMSHRYFKQRIQPGLERYRDYYRGNQWYKTPETATTDRCVSNMIFTGIRAILPRLNYSAPKIYVTAKKRPYKTSRGVFDTMQGAILMELILNYYYKILQTKREARKCLVDSLTGYFGIMEIGYMVKTEKVKDDELLQINELLREDTPYTIRRSPFDFRFDTEATDSLMEDARWIALKEVIGLDDLKRDDRFSVPRSLKNNIIIKKDFATVGLEGGGDDKRIGLTLTDEDDLLGRVEMWHIWDKKEHKLRTYVEGCDKFLREENWPLDYEGFPIEILYFNENPDEAAPISDIDIYIDAQDELNRLRSLQIAHVRKISERKYLMNSNTLKDDQKYALTHGGDGTCIDVDGSVDNIKPLQDASISQDFYMLIQQLEKNIREMQGISAAEMLSGSDSKSASESRMIDAGAQSIREDQKSLFEDFLVRVIKKMAFVLSETTDSEREIPLRTQAQFDDAQKLAPKFVHKLERITGEGNGEKIIFPFLRYRKEDIAGEYDFDVEVGSTQYVSQHTRKQDALTLGAALKGNPAIDIHEATRQLLEAFKVQDVDKMLKDPKKMQQEQMARQKMMLEAQLALDQPKRDVDLMKTQAKTETAKQIAALQAQTALTTIGIESQAIRDGKAADVMAKRESNKTKISIAKGQMMDNMDNMETDEE